MTTSSVDISHCCAKAGAVDWDSPCAPGCDGYLCRPCLRLWKRGGSVDDTHPGERVRTATRTCAECGKPFVVPRRKGRRLVCSEPCIKERRRRTRNQANRRRR